MIVGFLLKCLQTYKVPNHITKYIYNKCMERKVILQYLNIYYIHHYELYKTKGAYISRLLSSIRKRYRENTYL